MHLWPGDIWVGQSAVIGIFLLGAAMGALLTWIACASQMLEIQRLIDIITAKYDSNSNLHD
jgi:uncharacterized membrane protein YoaK (UPF0700 family)